MPDDVGSFADEAARLVDAIQGWSRGRGTGRPSAAVGHMATGDDACCVCPVCAVIVLLRGERPELTIRLMESLTGLVSAGQGLIETLGAVAADARAGAPAGGTAAPDNGAAGNGASGNGAAGNGAAGNGAAGNGAAGNAQAGHGTPADGAQHNGTSAGGTPPRVQNIPLD